MMEDTYHPRFNCVGVVGSLIDESDNKELSSSGNKCEINGRLGLFARLRSNTRERGPKKITSKNETNHEQETSTTGKKKTKLLQIPALSLSLVGDNVAASSSNNQSSVFYYQGSSDTKQGKKFGKQKNEQQAAQPQVDKFNFERGHWIQDQGGLAGARYQREYKTHNYEREEDDDEDDEEEGGWFAGRAGANYPSASASQQQRLGFGRASPSSCRRLQEPPMSSFEDLLDDRQGMNSGQQNELRTKGEVEAMGACGHLLGRASIDGSIISERTVPGNKNGGSSKQGPTREAGRGSGSAAKVSGKTSNQAGSGRRPKSPSAGSGGGAASSGQGASRSSRSSKAANKRVGLFGLASRLRLTRRHDSIAGLQLTILQSGLISLKKLDRDLQTFLPAARMSGAQFGDHVKLIRKYPVLAAIEYKFASRYETYVCRHAQHEANEAKNNYKKCIPYDYNRVVLRTIPGVSHSDYVNASYVDSYLKPNAYIAAQGPNELTIEAFWRMVWEERSYVIVMLTKVFDFIRVMCNQYWPVELNKAERYGSHEVTLLYEEPLADFVIRTIRVTRLRPTTTPDTHSSPGPNQSKAGTNSQTNINGMNDHHHKRPTSRLTHSDDHDEATSSRSSASASSLKDAAQQEDKQTGPHSQEVEFDQAPKVEVRRPNSGNSARRPKFMIADANEHPSRDPPTNNEPATNSQHQHAPNNKNNNSISQLTSKQHHQPLASMTNRRPNVGGQGGANNNNNMNNNINKNNDSQTTNISEPQLVKNSSTGSGSNGSTTTKTTRPGKTQFQIPNKDDCQCLDDGESAGGGSESGGPSHSWNGNRERIVYQFHYHNWASHTVPFIGSLLHFRRRVRICTDQMAKSGQTGPTIVHCNDGCGRTGAYLCIDANLELADEDGVYDVFNYTKKLRQSRKYLIENLDQYKFVYDTLEESLFCGKTWFNVNELHQKLKHKSHRNSTTKKNEYQIEYEKICRMTSRFSIGDCAGGHRVENREKNRDVSTVPPDNFRPYLTSFQTNDSTDYINAVFVDGYTRSKEYIVTEWPLHRTMSDFWSLVYDHDCNSVILLANPPESSTYPSFLPTEKELRRKFGAVFSAEMVSYTHYQNIKSWIYTINKKIVSLTEVIAGVKSETKTTQVFQITCWPQGHRVPTSTNALVELMNMVERWRQRTTYGPVCVVSLDGKSRAGVYCAANVAIEQVVQHGEVDVFRAVKTVRRHRPQLIENMTEYKYCYDLILHYVLHYLNQSNSSANG